MSISRKLLVAALAQAVLVGGPTAETVQGHAITKDEPAPEPYVLGQERRRSKADRKRAPRYGRRR